MTEPASRTSLTIEKDGKRLFEAFDDSLPTMLLGLLCHEAAAEGSTINCGVVTRQKATLLASARPARVCAQRASIGGCDVLREAGVELTLAEAQRVPDERPDAPPIREFDRELGSPTAFRHRLRMHMLSSLQKNRVLQPDWFLASPETHLGGGGGGT